MEWIGQILAQFPVWVSLPIAFVIVGAGWAAWLLFVDPAGSDKVESWIRRRRYEKEQKHGKK